MFYYFFKSAFFICALFVSIFCHISLYNSIVGNPKDEKVESMIVENMAASAFFGVLALQVKASRDVSC